MLRAAALIDLQFEDVMRSRTSAGLSISHIASDLQKITYLIKRQNQWKAMQHTRSDILDLKAVKFHP